MLGNTCGRKRSSALCLLGFATSDTPGGHAHTQSGQQERYQPEREIPEPWVSVILKAGPGGISLLRVQMELATGLRIGLCSLDHLEVGRKRGRPQSSLVVQQGKDPAWSLQQLRLLLWRRFDP